MASSALQHKSLGHALSLASGIGIILMALATPLREVSQVLQRWTIYVGSATIGASLGILMRLLVSAGGGL